jgi:hypothetical protein
VVIQFQPPSTAGQSLFAFNWSGVTVSSGSTSHFHDTCAILAGPVNMRSALVGQFVFVRVI